MGSPLVFDDVEPYKKSSYTSKREENVFTQAGGGDDDDRPPMALTPSGASLNDWHTRYKDRFMLADLMETLCSDRVRHSGGEAQGTVHTECPFEHEHTSEGGTATMAINCLDSHTEYWTWFCHHDACQGRHKLQMLEEALRQNWFEEDNLFNVGLGFVLEAADDEEEEDPDDDVIEDIRSPFEQALAFTKAASDEEIKKFIKKQFKQGVDLSTQAQINEALVKSTSLGKREIKMFWKQFDDEQRKRDREKNGEVSKVAVINQWDFKNLHEYGERRIRDVNQENPKLFHYMESLYKVGENAKGFARMKPVNKEQFARHLNTEPPRVYRRVKFSKDEPYDTTQTYPVLYG